MNMKNIQVSVINEAHSCPGGMMMFLAKLTQRGHQIKNMDDLKQLYKDSMGQHKAAKRVVKMPHGTIKRFTPITIAVVGASRRFLAQARTHHVGIDFVSASLQYSDYSGNAKFVVPYELTELDNKLGTSYVQAYLDSCTESMKQYKALVDAGIDNDTAGYIAPQGLRNILIIQGNHDAWLNFIRLRACHRNTKETQYVTLKIWEALLETADGEEMFAWAGPDCMYDKCREGKMSCGDPIFNEGPTSIINEYFPLIARGDD
jgi:thymidylate synthase (FAD)